MFRSYIQVNIYNRTIYLTSRRSLMTQLRFGILPPEIETGRFTPVVSLWQSIKKEQKEEGIYNLCDLKPCLYLRAWNIQPQSNALPVAKGLNIHSINTIISFFENVKKSQRMKTPLYGISITTVLCMWFRGVFGIF